jgi:hypothetical protein
MKTISDEALRTASGGSLDAAPKDPGTITVSIDPESIEYHRPSGPTLPEEPKTNATPILRTIP